MYTVIDIETTGVSHIKNEIIQVGLVRTDKDFNVISAHQYHFYKPTESFKSMPRAYQVHKLTDEYLESKCPDDMTFNKNGIELMSKLNNSIWVGKNNERFDNKFLTSFCMRHFEQDINPRASLDLQRILSPYYKERFNTTKLGTLKQYVDWLGVQDKIEMIMENEVAHVVDKEIRTSYHNALYDCVATLACLKAVNKR